MVSNIFEEGERQEHQTAIKTFGNKPAGQRTEKGGTWTFNVRMGLRKPEGRR